MPDKSSRVVVGVDGSDGSISAARWAGAVAEKFDTSLHLVHSSATTGQFIADAAVIAIRAAATADQSDAAEKILAATGRAVHEDIAALPITTEIVGDSAPKALVELSRTASLVVVGCDDVNPVAALLVGSTSLAVATHAVCPVVVWRGVARPNAKSVVVGVDGTQAGAGALAAAFEYAHHFKVPLKAVHSWSTNLPPDQVVPSLLLDWEAVEIAERAVLIDAVDEWSTRYPDVNIQLFVDAVKPGRALIQQLDDAQLVVVGNRRHNALTAAVLGSTTLNLLHHSAVPVMVCHAAEGIEQ